MGFNMPVGVIVWISTFMSLSMELFNFNVLGTVGNGAKYNAVFNAQINMLNPTFGISFLINARKPSYR